MLNHRIQITEQMKKYLYSALLCMASLTLFCACEGNDPDKKEQKQTLNYDLMVGTWNLETYSVVITNLDENKEVENFSRNKGTMVVTKKTDTDSDTYYYYTDNFINEKGEEYSGRCSINGTTMEMCAEDGFMRSDGATTYDFTISLLTDKRMEWTYDATHNYSHKSTSTLDEAYKRRTVAKVVLTK